MRLENAIEPIHPLRACSLNGFFDVLISRKGQEKFGRNTQLCAYLMKKDVTSTCAACDSEQNAADVQLGLNCFLDRPASDRLLIRRKSRSLSSWRINHVSC